MFSFLNKIGIPERKRRIISLGLVLFGVIIFFFILNIFIGNDIKIVVAHDNPGTNIDPTIFTDPPYDSSGATSTFWAWNEITSWIDFHNTHTVQVKPLALKGYASSSLGEISLNCFDAPGFPDGICGRSNYKVINDEGEGNLLGWAWNDVIGWISFCGNQGWGLPSSQNCPGPLTPNSYRVSVMNVAAPNTPPSDFRSYAWNDVVGWISFNCEDFGCGASDYRVRTSWFVSSTYGYLDSATFDTEIEGGAQFNSILWKGDIPAGTEVRFQLATSNSPDGPGGDWGNDDFVGPNGTSGDFYIFDTTSELDKEHGYYFVTLGGEDYTIHNNKRYFRYRVWLLSNSNATLSPRVDEVIVNWSP